MTSKIKVAQIGVGYWGPALLRNLTSNPRCEVSIVADLSEERRDFVRNSFTATSVVDDPKYIFEDPEIKAVVIATPAATHFDLASRALKAGKHILVEKPMATCVKDVQRLGQLAQERNLTAMVGHTFIYHPAVHYLRDIINLGELGQVRYVYSQRLNLGRIRSDCDVLWNLAPHDISIVQFLLGDPVPLSVHKTGMDYVQRGIDDVVFVNITYPNRVLANFHLSWLDPNRTRSLTVVGSEKMAVYDDTKPNKIAIYDKGIDRLHTPGSDMDYDRPTFSLRSGKVYEPTISSEEPLAIEVSHFLDCVEYGIECWTGPEHAAKVVKILSDCDDSAPNTQAKGARLETGASQIPIEVWK
jgi:predicted dehydrogenase